MPDVKVVNISFPSVESWENDRVVRVDSVVVSDNGKSECVEETISSLFVSENVMKEVRSGE